MKKTLLAKILGVFLLVILFVALLQFVTRDYDSPQPATGETDTHTIYQVPPENVFLFPGLSGPEKPSVVAPPAYTSWHQFQGGSASRLAVLLTDTTSAWLGLVQGFQAMGIPFTLTTSVQEAIRHPMVWVYPELRGKAFSQEDIAALASHGRNNSTAGDHPVLMASALQGGGLEDLFGVSDPVGKRTRYQLIAQAGVSILDQFTEPEERKWRLGDPYIYSAIQPTMGYQLKGKAVESLFTYEDGSTAIGYRALDSGNRLLLWGIDLGDYTLRNTAARGYEGYAKFANVYEPGLQVLWQMVKRLYVESRPRVSMAAWTVPHNKSLVLNITHDVDFTRSITNGVEYARWEKEAGVPATYFIQTKYVKDWNDDLFLNKTGAKCVGEIEALGMEVASHSVAHSYVYKQFEMGTGQEQYPSYQPFVVERSKCFNGTILGELRVSKFLLEHFAPNSSVTSFRPGHLSNPFRLPEAIMATGFQVVSTNTAAALQGYFPVFSNYSRERTSQTNVVELPIAVEDELDHPMINRIGQAIRLGKVMGKFGGYYNALIHTDTLGQKIEFEQHLVAGLRSSAYMCTVKEAGKWYKAIMKMTMDVEGNVLTLRLPPDVEMPAGLTLMTARNMTIQAPGVQNAGTRHILPAWRGSFTCTIGG